MSAELKQLGERIRTCRQRLGMTQTELAAGCEVTRNMLSRIEHGAAYPSLPTLTDIAARMKVPVGVLLGDPEDFMTYQRICDLKRLYAAGKYAQVITEAAQIAAMPDELAELLVHAHTEMAKELFEVGRLGDALAELDAAEALADTCRYGLSALREQIMLLRLLIDACPALSETDDGAPAYTRQRETLRAAVFDEKELAIYLWCRSELAEAAPKAYSEPHPDAAALRARVEPFASGLKESLWRGHIEALLAMTEADYLGAKAILTTLAVPEVPPSVLYELYGCLELCCKCCGDFENAYKYAGLRLELIKKIF